LIRPDVDLTDEPHGGTEVLKQAKIELRMNISLLETLKGNTALEDLANLREAWVEPIERLVRDIESLQHSDPNLQHHENCARGDGPEKS
jgi:hypothetical protein